MTDDPHNTLPIYAQVAAALTREIAEGHLLDGERLAPERDLARQMGVSVGTLRKALKLLTEKKLLRRVQGSGNYIDAGGVRDSLYAMFRLELHEGRGFPRADLLGVQTCDKPSDLPKFGVSRSGTRIRRLRMLNDTPVAVEEIWLDGGAGHLREQDLSDALYRTYQDKLGVWITRAEDRVGLGQVPGWAPAKFALPPGTTCGYIERLSWADQPQAVEFSRNWFDPAGSVYVQRIT